jgi:hypothetical protein
VILPNFIGIGAPKAGTTWLATCLGQHPEIFMARVKETEFWKLVDAERRLEEYSLHFNGAAGAKAVGEFSVRYLYFPGVPERVKRVLPHAKLLVSLRNPIDQVYSNYWHLQRQNFNLPHGSEVPRSIEQALREHREFLLVPARYATHLARWLEHFPREQLLVIRYDDIQRRPEEVLKRVFTFLAVDPEFQSPSMMEKGTAVRQGTSPRSERAGHLHSKVYGGLVRNLYTPMKQLLGTRNAARIKEALRIRPMMETLFMRKGYPPMSAATRATLAKEFAPEIEKLTQLTGLDFETWK